ncbi:endo alpha-1,4 polygalactosaminidase [Thermococcus sp.]|uniref:endo alpha-1,4 polygalactosaminidase n=1 Tax=Thermococcus sp. TaxID=35749 RepID=UPI00262054B4|nr:endo alpha-1,4 polygalactosaminidase [Thermococcus sp.]
MSRWVELSFLLLLLLFSAVPVSSSSFAVYYGQLGNETLGELGRFNLLILSPTVEPSYVSRLSREHTVVGYLSLATVGGWEPWAGDVPESIIIGKNPRWGERVVDFSSSIWREVVLNRAIPYILSRGFNGVFLDNLDYVDVYPKKRNAMIELIREIKERYPGIVIVANRGFSIKEEIAPYVDYFLFEDFVTYYNFSARRYEIFKGAELEWELKQLEELQKLNVSVLALGYANLSNERQVEKFGRIVCSYAKKYHVSGVYLAGISLQKVGVEPCQNSRLKGGGKSSNSGGKVGKVCGPGSILLLTLILLWRRFL